MDFKRGGAICGDIRQSFIIKSLRDFSHREKGG